VTIEGDKDDEMYLMEDFDDSLSISLKAKVAGSCASNWDSFCDTNLALLHASFLALNCTVSIYSS
jgi:hypothetical protein